MTSVISTEPAVEPVTLQEAKTQMRVCDTADDAYISTLITAARQWVETQTGRAIVNQTWVDYRDLFADDMTLAIAPLSSVTNIKYYDTGGVLQTLAPSAYTADTVPTPGRVVLAYAQSWPAVQDVVNAVQTTYVAGYGAAPTGKVFTAAASDTCTSAAHGYAAGEAVTLTTTTTLPAGLDLNTTYYVGSVLTNTFELFTSEADSLDSTATAVDITDTGTGVHTITGTIVDGVPRALRQAILLMIGHWYENREATIVGVSINEVPMAVKSLLWQYKVAPLGVC